MKKTNESYDQQLDEIALEAMKCILSGTYSHPGILLEMEKIATDRGRSTIQEVAVRAYGMAAVMLQTRKEYISGNGKDGDDKP